MKIEYSIRGITLSEHELVEIHSYYEAACTADQLLSSCDKVRSEKQALELGYAVRQRMDKAACTEQEAIDHVLKEANV